MRKDLNKLSIVELEKELATAKKKIESVTKHKQKDSPYIIGQNYLIRSVTMIYTGKLEQVYEKELVFSNVSWIPETERWSDTVEKGIFKEVEPYPKEKLIPIGRGALLEVIPIDWALPTEQK